MKNYRILPVLACFALPVAVVAGDSDGADLEIVHRIKQEAFEGSQVMDHLFFLTDVNGPRLSGSPGYLSAARWAAKTMDDWGLKNSNLEAWGEFGRGWSLSRYEAHLIEPTYAPLGGVPLAWSGATKGPVTAGLVYAPLFERWEQYKTSSLQELEKTVAEYIEKNRGKLKGKMVLLHAERKFDSPTKPASHRLEADELSDLSDAPEPYAVPRYTWPDWTIPEDPVKRREFYASAPLFIRADWWDREYEVRNQLSQFFHEEGPVAVLVTDNRGQGSLVFAEEVGSAWKPGAPVPPPSVVLAPEAYSRLVRLVQRDVPVKLQMNLQASFHDDDLQGYNVVAEIPGHDKKNELVMLGGHLDSWHAGTGATDNAAGCAVAMEAVRILKTLDLDMDRTVRLALWGGEEQGLLGSRGYVSRHFGDPITMELKPEHATLSGYFNLDNGTGKIRGVHLQENDMMRPIFESWFAPFKDLGATTITIRNTGGTDHLSFNDVGLPGFQFIQDPLDYGSRTHHSNLDVYDHVIPADLMQASAIMAYIVYQAATREEMLPRKPLPQPLGN